VTGVVEVGREGKARGVNSCPEGRSRVFFFLSLLFFLDIVWVSS